MAPPPSFRPARVRHLLRGWTPASSTSPTSGLIEWIRLGGPHGPRAVLGVIDHGTTVLLIPTPRRAPQTSAAVPSFRLPVTSISSLSTRQTGGRRGPATHITLTYRDPTSDGVERILTYTSQPSATGRDRHTTPGRYRPATAYLERTINPGPTGDDSADTTGPPE